MVKSLEEIKAEFPLSEEAVDILVEKTKQYFTMQAVTKEWNNGAHGSPETLALRLTHQIIPQIEKGRYSPYKVGVVEEIRNAPLYRIFQAVGERFQQEVATSGFGKEHGKGFISEGEINDLATLQPLRDLVTQIEKSYEKEKDMDMEGVYHTYGRASTEPEVVKYDRLFVNPADFVSDRAYSNTAYKLDKDYSSFSMTQKGIPDAGEYIRAVAGITTSPELKEGLEALTGPSNKQQEYMRKEMLKKTDKAGRVSPYIGVGFITSNRGYASPLITRHHGENSRRHNSEFIEAADAIAQKIADQIYIEKSGLLQTELDTTAVTQQQVNELLEFSSIVKSLAHDRKCNYQFEQFSNGGTLEAAEDRFWEERDDMGEDFYPLANAADALAMKIAEKNPQMFNLEYLYAKAWERTSHVTDVGTFLTVARGEWDKEKRGTLINHRDLLVLCSAENEHFSTVVPAPMIDHRKMLALSLENEISFDARPERNEIDFDEEYESEEITGNKSIEYPQKTEVWDPVGRLAELLETNPFLKDTELLSQITGEYFGAERGGAAKGRIEQMKRFLQSMGGKDANVKLQANEAADGIENIVEPEEKKMGAGTQGKQ